MASAHAHGVIHRDIKPENLMLSGDGQVKVLDFGIAKRADSPAGTTTTMPLTTTATDSRVIAGTPQYMAPEACYGGRIDQRTDIFSLGVVFYELLTGVQPFAGPTLDFVFQRVMNVTPPPVTEVNPAAGRALSDTVARMLAKDPDQRPASCREVLDDLGRARLGVATPRSDPHPTRARRRMRAAGLVGRRPGRGRGGRCRPGDESRTELARACAAGRPQSHRAPSRHTWRHERLRELRDGGD
jgi:serine/threonine-protein kinase